MGFRERRQERREERREPRDDRRGGGAVHYRMRQRLVSIGDDYWIEDDEGRRVFKVDGKALRIRQTLHFEDAQGNLLLKIQERKLRLRDTMEIEDANGRTLTTVKKALVSPLRHRMSATVEGGQDLDVQGNILDHEYSIEAGGAKLRRCPSGGSGSLTPTVSRSPQARTRCCCWPSRQSSTRWPTRSASVASTAATA
jgi:uncharacterized protein YxjI